MSSENLLDDLDYEDDGESADQEYYCAVCCECFDEATEFKNHLSCPKHATKNSQRQAMLQNGDAYCDICVMKVDCFDLHSTKNEEHIQYFQSMKRCNLHKPNPSVMIFRSLSQCQTSKILPSPTIKSKEVVSCKSSSIKSKLVINKCIGLVHIKRQESQWFCGLCLEKFTESIEIHCTHAVHAIQTIKQFDPEVAYKIKISVPNNSLISAKAIEIYEKEKETAEYERFMLQLDQFEQLSTKPNNVLGSDKSYTEESKTDDVIKPSTEKENSLENDRIIISNISKADFSQDQVEIDNSENRTSHGENIQLFEDDDYSLIQTPVPNEVKKKNDNLRKTTADNCTVLVGLKYLKLKGKIYYCSLCDITCNTTLESCQTHMASSLHQKKMINIYLAHPVPDYLENLRKDNFALYSQLVNKESRKIEAEEQKIECVDMKKKRAGILKLKTIADLPEPLYSGIEVSDTRKDLNLIELAEEWNFKRNEKSPNTISKGRNKTAIQPIQPRMGSVLIGVNAIRHISDLKFMCTICNIKFDIKPGRSEKHHVNGRLHKIKALVAVHGEIIDQYLQYRSKKDGYENLNAIINEACIPVEKIEKENESQENRGIRAMLLGVKADQLPLPMITMLSKEPLDIKDVAEKWLSEKIRSVKGKDKAIDLPSKSRSSTAENNVPDTANSQPLESENGHITTIDRKVRNVFEICKPVAISTPKDLSKNEHKTGLLMKNIDINGLTKSLTKKTDLGASNKFKQNSLPEEANRKEHLGPSSSKAFDYTQKRKSVDTKNTDSPEGQFLAKKKICTQPISSKPNIPMNLLSKHQGKKKIVQESWSNEPDMHCKNQVHQKEDIITERKIDQFSKYPRSPNKAQHKQSNWYQNRTKNYNLNSGSDRIEQFHFQGRNDGPLNASNCKVGYHSDGSHERYKSDNRNVPQSKIDRECNYEFSSTRHYDVKKAMDNNDFQHSSRDYDIHANSSSFEFKNNRIHKHTDLSPQKFGAKFDIDIRAMKKSSLSSALARVTNISPISQACNAKINQHGKMHPSSSQNQFKCANDDHPVRENFSSNIIRNNYHRNPVNSNINCNNHFGNMKTFDNNLEQNNWTNYY